MITLQPITIFHRHYRFVEELLHSAFPKNERRDDELQRTYTEKNKKFHCLLIRNAETPVGLLTYWDLNEFVYVEHFAIHESMRNNGLGSQAMKAFLQGMDRPVVLEVEIPRRKGDLPHRRISFYRRLGISPRRMPYRQPPYRKGDDWLPMKLMSTGATTRWMRIAEKVRDTIHREVYGVTP